MSTSDWLKGTLQNGGQKTGAGPESGDNPEWGQKVGTAKSLTLQGFQEAVHTNHTVHTEKQLPRKNGGATHPATTGLAPIGDLTAGIVAALVTGQQLPAPAQPADLLERVNLICQLERWAAADRTEWVEILQRQIDRDAVPPRELVATLDAHIERWHTNSPPPSPPTTIEAPAAEVNDCMTCQNWEGVKSYAEGRYRALAAAGVDAKPKTMMIGACRLRNRPWRISNIAGSDDYRHWHFVGHCGRKAA